MESAVVSDLPPVFDHRTATPGLLLGALPGAVPCGRLHVRGLVWEWGLGRLAEEAELVVSELLTNAVEASATDYGPIVPVWLRLYTNGEALLIEVGDFCRGVPMLSSPASLEDHGRGLLLVDNLSERWGYYFPRYGRKVVWAILR